MDNKALLLADACAGDWDAVRPHLVVQMLRDQHARIEELEDMLRKEVQHSAGLATIKAVPAAVEVPGADYAARFKAQHDFLNWNRAQQHPPVKIAQEYGVFNNALYLYQAALAATPAAQADELEEAQAQDVQRDAVGFKTADCVNVLPGDKVWVRGSSGIHESTVGKAVTNYMLFSSPIPVDQSYSSESAIRAAIAASAAKGGEA